jgi:SpoVK/Ycf46/Vps4 family AAA+-type ATPase
VNKICRQNAQQCVANIKKFDRKHAQRAVWFVKIIENNFVLHSNYVIVLNQFIVFLCVKHYCEPLHQSINMEPYPHSCDKIRDATLGMLKFLEPGYDNIIARENYFEQVDDPTKTNNYCDLVKNETKSYPKLFNPKWWRPIHAQSNIDKFIEEWGYDWPKKSEEAYQRIEGIFDEIDTSFQKKGLKSASIPGVKRYTPSNTNRDHPNDNKQGAPQRTSNESASGAIKGADAEYNPILDDERLKNIDRKIAERILNEIVSKKTQIGWDDIAGLENVKQAINEIVVYPMLNPSLFKGLLAPAKGLLLFGPPGTGKTLIGKCIACESGATFFAISASSLTSKWVGEGEKMVRALFAVARVMQPSVVFIDEIDSLLTQRVDGEHDSSRRMKTEFLVQFDGVSTGADDRLLIVGATNRPQELDEAARRRFTKRIYISLPNETARRQIIENLMKKQKNNLTSECLDYIADRTAGFSGADMAGLCKEAAMIVVRSVLRSGQKKAQELSEDDLPPISRNEFDLALKAVKASVSGSDMSVYEIWDKNYGASRDI